MPSVQKRVYIGSTIEKSLNLDRTTSSHSYLASVILLITPHIVRFRQNRFLLVRLSLGRCRKLETGRNLWQTNFPPHSPSQVQQDSATDDAMCNPGGGTH